MLTPSPPHSKHKILHPLLLRYCSDCVVSTLVFILLHLINNSILLQSHIFIHKSFSHNCQYLPSNDFNFHDPGSLIFTPVCSFLSLHGSCRMPSIVFVFFFIVSLLGLLPFGYHSTIHILVHFGLRVHTTMYSLSSFV